MGMTIEDIFQEETQEEDYLHEEIEEKIRERKTFYSEGGAKIFEYLPVNKNSLEDNYINHLWDAFVTLNGFGEHGIGFSIMPFHLLFMLSIQYKVMRIIRVHEKECLLVFSTVGGRDKKKLLNPQRSVFDLACLNERILPELLQLLSVDEEVIKKIKTLVDYRNDSLAHPKGGIESNHEEIINRYIEILELIQPYLLPVNNQVARAWMGEMEPGDSGVEYVQLHLAEEYLCPADMGQGNLVHFANILE